MTRLLFASLLLAACGSPNERETFAPDASPDVLDIDAPPEDAPLPSAALWLLLTDGDAGTNELAKGDPTSFAVLERTTIPYVGTLWELAGMGTELAYAIDRDTDRLIGIDLETASVVSNVQLGGDVKQNGRGFGTAPDGTLWGIFDGTLAQVDPLTGALSNSVVQQYGLIAESLETCAGQLYMASRESGGPRGEKLYTVERTIGSATLLGTIATGIDIDTLACVDGALYGLDTDPAIGKMIYRMASATGAGTVMTTLAVTGDINGLHFTPGVTPTL